MNATLGKSQQNECYRIALDLVQSWGWLGDLLGPVGSHLGAVLGAFAGRSGLPWVILRDLWTFEAPPPGVVITSAIRWHSIWGHLGTGLGPSQGRVGAGLLGSAGFCCGLLGVAVSTM